MVARHNPLQMDGVGKEGTTPIPVTLHDGSVLNIWPVLGWVEGDIPWLAHMTNSVGHGGKHSCFRCALNGVWNFMARTVRCGRFANAF